MSYLTYAEYTSMGGSATQSAFARAEYRACKQIDKVTHGRVASESPVRDAVKNLAFDLVEVYAAEGERKGQLINSVSNDGISVSYMQKSQRDSEIAALCRDYLSDERTDAGTLLLYGGIDA